MLACFLKRALITEIVFLNVFILIACELQCEKKMFCSLNLFEMQLAEL